jgi:1-deoxy-D-xylulose-5-phosphate reductoisomerase
VQFEDGSMKAQMGLPDMKLPIQFALTFPQRLPTTFPRFNFMDYPQLTFEAPDRNVFKNLNLAFKVMDMQGTAACSLNAANEVAVDAFLHEKIRFLEINEAVVQSAHNFMNPSYEQYVEADQLAREKARSLIQQI